jgi:Mor family transcriptional regulator
MTSEQMASGILQDLVELIGHQAAIELVRAMGGRRLKIPATISDAEPHHPLVFIVGLTAAQKLADAYGGAEAIDLPAERNYLIDMRNDAILAGFRADESITWLAHTYGISRRQVNSVLDRMGHRRERLARAESQRGVATRT